MREIRYLISDASKKIEVESHVLRYWEEELNLDIPRNELGHRYYRQEDIELLSSVKSLKEKGFQLKAIRMLLPDISKIEVLENDRLMDLRDKLDELLGITREPEDDMESMLQELRSSEEEKKVNIESHFLDAVKIKEESNIVENLFEPENFAEAKTSGEKEKGIYPAFKENSKVVDMTGVIAMERQEVLEKGENDSWEDKLAQFRIIMSSIMTDAVKKNNETLMKDINSVVSESVRKEVDYLLHLKEEREEERFKKLDRTIREYQLSRQQSAAAIEVEQKKRKKSKFFKKNKVHI